MRVRCCILFCVSGGTADSTGVLFGLHLSNNPNKGGFIYNERY